MKTSNTHRTLSRISLVMVLMTSIGLGRVHSQLADANLFNPDPAEIVQTDPAGFEKTDSIIDCTTTTLHNLVEMFDAVKDDKCVNLQWKTASIDGLSEYVIRRSDADGLTTLGNLPVSNGVDKYNYFDMKPHQGSAVYHLYSRDHNGLSCHLQSKFVDFVYPTELDLKVFPNPVSGNSMLNMEMLSSSSKHATMLIRDAAGRQVAFRTLHFDNPWMTIQFDMSPFEPGMYTLFLQAGKDSKACQLSVTN